MTLLSIIPSTLTAQLSGVVDTVGTSAGLSTFGGADPVGLIIILSSQLVGLVDVVAGFFLVISGLRLVYRASDEQVERSKNRIAASIVAIMLAHLTPILVDVIYGPTTLLAPLFGATRFESLTNISTGIGLANVEVCGIIRWIEVPIATIAVLVIIVSGLKAVVSYGSEEGITNIKRTVLAVAAGGILILARIAIMSSLGLTMTCGGGPAMPGLATTVPILAFALNLVNGLLAFLALVSVGIIVYAGIMMILTMGSEEVFGRMKGLIIRAAVGLTICLASYTIIFFVFGSI